MKIDQFNQVARITAFVWRFDKKGRCNLNYVSQVLGVQQANLPNYAESPIWKRIGHYIAQLCVNIFLITSVEKIVIGGGLSENPYLLSYAREEFSKLINGYIKIPKDEYSDRGLIIVPAMKGKMNELFGAALAAQKN